MTIRFADRLFLIGFILVGAYYLFHSFELSTSFAGISFGPGHFPIILGGLLIALCLAQLAVSYFGKSTHEEVVEMMELPNFGMLALTIGLIALFYIAWSVTEHFYIPAGIFFFALVASYTPKRTVKSMATAATIAFLFTLSLFLIFDVALGVALG